MSGQTNQTIQQKEFSPEVVLSVVARELSYSLANLKIGAPVLVSSYESGSPKLVAYQIKSSDGSLSVVVHRGQDDASLFYRRSIGRWLANGHFFNEVEVDLSLVEAVGRACNPSDLVIWVTAQVREGWMADTENYIDTEAGKVPKTIATVRKSRSKMLGLLLSDPVEAVIKLCHQDPAASLATFVEQGQLGEATLTEVILKACGGWEGLSFCEVMGTTPEGFIIEADNEHTAGYLRHMYELRNVK